MSVVGDIMTAVLAEVTTAVAGITTLQGEIPPGKIPSGSLPHAQAFDAAMVVQRELIFRQEEQFWAFNVKITDTGVTTDAMAGYFDAIETQLDTNRTLTSTVRWVKLTGAQVIEKADAKVNRQTLDFEVVAEVLV